LSLKYENCLVCYALPYIALTKVTSQKYILPWFEVSVKTRLYNYRLKAVYLFIILFGVGEFPSWLLIFGDDT
jgi:hypothetical protein